MAPKYRSPRTVGLLQSYTLTAAAGALTVPVRNAYSPRAIVTIVTANEQATASLQMVVNVKLGAGADLTIVSALGTPITAAGTYRYAITHGPALSLITGMTEEFSGRALSQDFDIVLTVTGAASSFDVTMTVAFI